MRIKTNNFTVSATRTYILIVVSALCYFIFAYYTQRYESTTIVVLYTILFISYLFTLNTELAINQLIFAGYFFRLIFLFSIPFLSDDFYRFIWDGRLMVAGINPFALVPTQVINNPALHFQYVDHELFGKLNSPEYYSVYPPVCQFTFWLSAIIGKGNLLTSVIVIRIFILAAEFGIILMLQKLFKIYGFDQKFTAIYFLNPLVILEFSGNLHYEAVMIFFVLVSVYFLKKNQFIIAGFLFALAISTKLLPLLFLPFVFKRIKVIQSTKFYATTIMVTALTFLPFVNYHFLQGFLASLSLYFQSFEFNASIFYIIREIGFLIKGIDVIQVAGVLLGILAVIISIFLAIREKKEKNLLLGIFIWPLFIFYALSTIVHPWYILPILAFSVFSRYRFPIVWTYLIFFTYLGYTESRYNENLVIVLLEYLILFSVIVYELILGRKTKAKLD